MSAVAAAPSVMKRASEARPTAGIKLRLLGHIRLEDVFVLLFCAGCAVLIFRLSLFEGWTFVGDSDRLNTALNIRLFETDAIRSRGIVPTWSDDQFMGYDVVAVHWMLPGFTPVPYLLALLPASDMYYALTVLAAVLLALTIGAAYWWLGAYTTSAVPRMAGALLYGFGAYTVHKLTQLDLSFAALAMAPGLMILVRETRRATAPRAFLGLAVCWAGLVLFTLFQEIAYIALLFGSYALFRSIRLRNPWPLTVASLAFVCGIAIGLPRVVTIAADFPLLARTSYNIQTEAVEALRYFGDGLIGRTPYEQSAVGGQFVNLHEGVQLLHSSLASLVVFAAGLLARSWVLRFWSVSLLAVVSVTLFSWWGPFYDSVFKWAPLTRQLRVALMNADLIGLPLWFVAGKLIARESDARAGLGEHPAAKAPADQTLAAAIDSPFFFAFAALGLAAILIPEAHALLYYGFLRIDFLHSRLSVAITLPLAAIVTIFLSRFMPTPAGSLADRRMIARWLIGGLVLGLGGWLAREASAGDVVARFGPTLVFLEPRRLLTIESFRVATSLMVLLISIAVLACRAPAWLLTLTGAALASWISLETFTAADFKLNGPQTTEQAVPFQSLNYMNTPPGQFRVPSPAERAAVQARLETDRYRVVLQQDPKLFAAHVEPHLGSFWGLRLVEGYSMGLPRRLAMLPWSGKIGTSHDLDIDTTDVLPWRLLAALNVKYAVIVDPSFWYNPAPGGPVPPFDAQHLEVLENPYPVTPRAFFAAQITPADEPPRLPGDDGVRPAPADPPVEDPAVHSVVEGIAMARTFPTDGSITATFDGDRVMVRVDPSSESRFLVLNEMYHPAWQARIDNQPTAIYPTNLVMRGLIVPPGATTIELRYVPFLLTWPGVALMVAGIGLTWLSWWGLRRRLVIVMLCWVRLVLRYGLRCAVHRPRRGCRNDDAHRLARTKTN